MDIINTGEFSEYNHVTSRIKRYFIIAALLIIALLIIIPFITVYLLTQEYDGQIRSETSQATTSIQRTVQSFVDGAYNLSYGLAENPLILTMDTDVQTPILANTVTRNDYMELLYVTGMDGMQTARSSGTPADRKNRWWFIQMMERRQPFVSMSYYSATTGMPCTAVFIPLYDENEMIGVFGADINLGYIQRLIEQFNNPAGGRYSFIIDGEGGVVAHPDSTYIETLTNYAELVRTVPETDASGNTVFNDDGSVVTTEERFTISDNYKAVIAEVMGGNSGMTIIEEEGKAYYVSFEPVRLPGYSDSWSVITLQDRDVAMKVVTQLVTQVLVIILLILLVLIILIFGFFRLLRSTLGFLENARTEAERANKSKTSFLATMSHEIRTPMNAIIGITQVQMQRADLPEGFYDVMQKIYSSGKSLLGIINDILDMSRIETGKLELNPVEYDVPSFINDTVQLNIVRIGIKQIEFILEVDEELPSRLYGDELRIKQILNNLLSNAIKYTEEGYVKLTVQHLADGDDVTLCFTVEDSGQGITREDKEKLFSEYLRFNIEANRTTEGTGLGLNITRKLVEMMNGSISVESEYGKGSVFAVTLMQKAVQCAEIGAEAAERLRKFTFMDGGRVEQLNITRTSMPYGRVLVVDDVDINLYVAEGVLQPYDLQIELADSGFAAIEKVEAGDAFDVIFMDHMMPKMDGIMTTQKLRELGYKGTIIALTANALVGNDEMFMRNGFDGFIPKPIDVRDIDDVLNKFVRDRHK